MPSFMICGVDLCAAGAWDLSSGKTTFTRQDLADAVEAAKCIGDPVIKLGHVDPRFDGVRVGRVRNLRTDKHGVKLIGDLTGMPSWLAQIVHSAYPRRSIEGARNPNTDRYPCGHPHPFVITGLALLGVTAPGVGVLKGLPEPVAASADESLICRVEFPAGPLHASAAEITDAEVDALWPGPARARRVAAEARQAPVTDDEVFRALFGSTTADTPGEARGLGW